MNNNLLFTQFSNININLFTVETLVYRVILRKWLNFIFMFCFNVQYLVGFNFLGKERNNRTFGKCIVVKYQGSNWKGYTISLTTLKRIQMFISELR